MNTAPVDSSEKKRLESLNKSNILTSIPNKKFDRITRLSSKIFACSVSGISFIDLKDVVVLSSVGIQNKKYPRFSSVEEAVFKNNKLTHFYDLSEESGFENFPFVVDGPKYKFFLGAPISTSDGQIMGVFFVADRMPRNLTESSKGTFDDVLSWVETEVNLLTNNSEKIDFFLLA